MFWFHDNWRLFDIYWPLELLFTATFIVSDWVITAHHCIEFNNNFKPHRKFKDKVKLKSNFLAPTGAQEVSICQSVCPVDNFCLSDSDSSGWLQDDLESIKQAFVGHSEGTQGILKEHSENNQSLSYRRSLKYFVLLIKISISKDLIEFLLSLL